MKFPSLLILLAILISTNLKAQIINKEIVTLGYEDCGAELFPAPDSGYYAFLYESKFVPTTLFLEMARLDKFGNLLWNKFFIQPVSTGRSPVCQLASGEFFISHLYNSPSGLAPVLMKVDTSGNILWSRQISDTLMKNYITEMYLADDSSIWLGGMNVDGMQVEYTLLNVDTGGNVNTTFEFLPDTSYYFKSIAKIEETDTHEFLVATHRESPDSSFYDVVKLSSNGQVLWSCQIPYPFLWQYSRDLMIEKDGGAIITLAAYNSNGNNVFRIDSTGTLQWQIALNRSVNGWTCYSICDSPDSGFYMTGSGTIDASVPSGGAVLCKFNNQGQLIGGEQMPGDTAASEAGYTLKILHGGKIVILGELCRIACNYRDGLIIIYDQPFITSVPDDTDETETFIIYPNPFHDKATLIIRDASSEMHLRIYNTVGKLVRETRINNPRSGITEVIIEREKLSEGLYFLEISNHTHAIARGKMIIN